MSDRTLSFFFVDYEAEVYERLDIDRADTFTGLMQRLREVSVLIATEIKSKTHGHKTHHFGKNDGPYLFRVVNMRHSPTGIAIYEYSEWSTVTHNSLWRLFEGPGLAIEIIHTLQHLRNVVAAGALRRAQRPPPPHLAAALAPNPTALATPVPAQLAPPDPPAPTPPPRPASAPASVAFSLPLAMPMRWTTRSPAPVDGVGSVVVRMPPVAAVVEVPVPVKPVETGWARGVVDSGAMGWYRREEQLRGWLRFGGAEAVESEDVWRGW